MADPIVLRVTVQPDEDGVTFDDVADVFHESIDEAAFHLVNIEPV